MGRYLLAWFPMILIAVANGALREAWLVPGVYALAWDGLTESGERTAPGIYYLDARAGARAWRRKLTRIE